MTSKPPKEPLIVVVGATGTGKSKLAVSLASKFNGEIINADAVQMYRGLPIVTNKISECEKNGIKHHLLDQIELNEDPWTVHEFIEATSSIVEEIRARGKLPIVVGGTNYYVFSLLLKEATLSDSGNESSEESDSKGLVPAVNPPVLNPQVDLSILDEPTHVIYAKLLELDPVMAKSWHPQDRRRIQRSLEICLKSGKKVSEIYQQQSFNKVSQLSDSATVTLRYDPLILWIDAEDMVLKDRLNARVDIMVQNGLLDEVKEMHSFATNLTRSGGKLNKTKGIWIAIGYKELEAWLDEGAANSGGQNASVNLFESGIEAIKASTRQYANSQKRWLRNRFAMHLKVANALRQFFLLDGTDLKAWDEMVNVPAEEITQKYLAGLALPKNASLSKLASDTFQHINDHGGTSDRQARVCESCDKTLMTESEWTRHMASRRHKRMVERIRRQALLENRQRETTSATV